MKFDSLLPGERLTRAFIWACLWAVVISAFKLGLFTLYKVPLSANYILGMAVALMGELWFATLLGLLLFYSEHALVRVLGYSAASLAFIYTALSYHYEIAFRSLPDAGILYYLKELSHLAPSLKSIASPLIIGSEVIVGILLIFISVSVIRKWKLDSDGTQRWPARILTVVVLSFLTTSAIHIFPNWFANADMFQASRSPWIWLAQSIYRDAGAGREELLPPTDSIQKFQRKLGHQLASSGKDPRYPLLSSTKGAGGNNPSRKSSVILLILESVGNAEMFSTIDKRPLMPNLQRIARDGLYFQNAHASGTKSNQALPSLFAGILPQTYNNILWSDPLPSLYGLPDQLRKSGYRTAYFHGSDLSFEQQRLFLKMVGFEEIVDYDEDLETTVAGWGYDDGTMLSMVQNWVNSHGAAETPYLASLFTLSTHDPFILPQHWQPVLGDEPVRIQSNGTWLDVLTVKERSLRFKESLLFLDHQLGAFYSWYLENEKPKGTLLVLVGDHVASLYNEIGGTAVNRMRFDVPLIIAGLPEAALQRYRPFQHRLASQYDIPATLSAYLGLDPLPADQGLDLLMPQSKWPNNRLVYAVGGQNLERVYMWTHEGEFEFNRSNRRLRLLNRTIDDAGYIRRISEQRIEPFLNTLFPLNTYLLKHNAYTPPEYRSFHNALVPVPEVEAPIFVSHRGNTHGMRKHSRQNKPEAIEEAIAAGFEWVEIDVQLTRDSIPILLHDRELALGNGERVDIADLSLQELRQVPGYDDTPTLSAVLERYGRETRFLIEIKPVRRVDRIYVLNRLVVEMLHDLQLEDRVIIDSFQELSVSFIKNRCRCDVGLDTQYQKKPTERQLKMIAHKSFDWIYLHHSVVDSDLIHKAHENGLRVMVYTVNDLSILERWRNNPPDGIITDRYDIKKLYQAEIRAKD